MDSEENQPKTDRQLQIECMFTKFSAEYIAHWAICQEGFEEDFMRDHKQYFAEYIAQEKHKAGQRHRKKDCPLCWEILEREKDAVIGGL